MLLQHQLMAVEKNMEKGAGEYKNIEIDILKNTNEKLVFIIKDINPAVTNSLRRTMSSEVPVMAIEEVNFLKNNSALFDEIIAHRLGLIPLKTDLRGYNIPEECSC